jgi:hypothetical protein
VREALSKLVSHMVNGHMLSIEMVMKTIADARLSWQAPIPARTPENEMTIK